MTTPPDSEKPWAEAVAERWVKYATARSLNPVAAKALSQMIVAFVAGEVIEEVAKEVDSVRTLERELRASAYERKKREGCVPPDSETPTGAAGPEAQSGRHPTSE